MKTIHAPFLVLALAAFACGGAAPPSQAVEPQTEEQKTLYALGLAMSDNLGPFNLSEKDLDYVKAGLTDGALRRKRLVDLSVYGPKLGELAQSRSAAGAAAAKASGAEFLSRVSLEKGAVKTPTGFVYVETSHGNGPSPQATDTVKVHYKGTMIDGTVFDSSIDRGQPAVFPLANVIPCWTQGLQMMKVGGKAKLVCPPELAYGDRGKGQIPGGATLVFEVELLGIEGK